MAPKYTDQDFMLDLSKLSNGTRFRTLEKMRPVLENEIISINEALFHYGDGEARKEMEGWRKAALDTLHAITIMQRKDK